MINSFFARLSPILWLAATILVLNLIWDNPIGRFHGKLSPVLNPTLTITKFTDIGDGRTQVAGQAKKVRDGCEFVPGSMTWFEGTGQYSVWKPSFFTDPPIKREGWTAWDGIVVGLNQTIIESNAYALVDHQCGFWPWKITSVYYDSRFPKGDYHASNR